MGKQWKHFIFLGSKIIADGDCSHKIKRCSFPRISVGKECACNAGDLGLIPESGRSPGEANGNHSSTLAWKIPRTEEPGRLQSMGSQESGMTWVTTPPPPPWKKSYDKPRQLIKKQRITSPTNAHTVKAIVFPIVMYGCNSWAIKAEHLRIDAFELWCCRRLLRIPWTARRSINSKGDQSRIFAGRTDWCWSSNTLATWCKELSH